MENKVIALDYLIIADIDQKQVLLTMKNVRMSNIVQGGIVVVVVLVFFPSLLLIISIDFCPHRNSQTTGCILTWDKEERRLIDRALLERRRKKKDVF